LRQRRPVKDVALGLKLQANRHVNALALLNATNVVAADSAGDVCRFELGQGKKNGNFKGAVGSVRDVDVYDGLVATVGLDRHVYVYSGESTQLVSKTYLKQRQNAVVFIASEQKKIGRSDTQADQAEEDDDEWWQQDVVVTDTKDAKRSKRML